MSTALSILLGIVLAGGGMFVADRSPSFGVWWYGGWAIVCTVIAALEAVQRQWGWAAWMAVCAIVNAIWWDHSRRRRKRKRAAALAGAKSRARIAKLVRRARESMQPRPVPQPVPRGTG